MLSKRERLDKKSIEQIFKKGRVINSPSFSFKFLVKELPHSRIAFIAPKKIAKLATRRNFLRRKGFNIFKKYKKILPYPILGAFVFKKYVDSTTLLESEIKTIISKL